MKRVYILLKYSLISLLGTMLLSSCTNDDMGGATPSVGGEVTFTMKLPVSCDVPTRTVGSPDENKIESMYVLLFDKNNSDKYKSTIPGDEISVASGGENNNKWTFKAEIPNGSYHLMFVANALESDLDGLDGKTFDEATGILEKSCPNTSGNDQNKWLAGGGHTIVMWGKLKDFSRLDVAQEIQMTRMLAKVTVINAAKNFELKDVRFCNYNLTGRIAPPVTGETNVPLLPENLQYGQDKALIYGTDKTIYVSEAKSNGEYKESEEGKSSWMANPCILIQGSYKNNPDSWYRLDFIDNNKKWLDVKRNHAYTLTIKSVSGNGYETDKEAFERAPINLDGEIGWDDQNLGDIYIDGEAFFTASSTLFNYEYDDSREGNNPSINNMTVRYIEKSLEITPKSNIIEITGDVNKSMSDGIGWLAITVTNIGTSRNDVYDFDISVSFDQNTTGAERTAAFEIKAGEKTIPVTVNQDYERELEVTTSKTDDIHICGEAEIPVTVKNHRATIYLKAVNKANNYTLNGGGTDPVPVVMGQTETTLSVKFNGGGWDRTVLLQWSYTPDRSPVENWTSFAQLKQIGDEYLLESGMYAARDDAGKMTWAQALGVDQTYNTTVFGSKNDQHTYNRTKYTGCVTYTNGDPATPRGSWWMPSHTDMRLMLERAAVHEPIGRNNGYWTQYEGNPGGGDGNKDNKATIFYYDDEGYANSNYAALKTTPLNVRCVSKLNRWNRALVR